MARKKMTEAEKKAWKAKMDAAKRRKRGPTLASTLKALGSSAAKPPRRRKSRAEKIASRRAANPARTQKALARLERLRMPSAYKMSSEAIDALAKIPPTAFKMSDEAIDALAKIPPTAFKMSAKAINALKKYKPKPAKPAKAKPSKPKPSKSKPSKAGSPTKRKPTKRKPKKNVICFPKGSAEALLLQASKGGKKPAKKGGKKGKKSPTRKSSAPKKSGRKSSKKRSPTDRGTRGEFVFPHASGSERACTKCGRLHSKREHWSHKLMHGTKKTQHSYLCARGGKCVFKRLASKKERAEALRIESERTKNPRRQAALALQYYQLIGRAGRGSRYSFGAESSKVTPERAARRRIIPAADPYERERREKEAEELAELEQAAEARAEGRLNRQWSRRY